MGGDINTAQPLKLELPHDAVIWPSMGVSSWITKRGGEYRLYVLARSLDPNGSGHIESDVLKAAAMQLHVKPRTFAAWMSGAVSCGVFEKLHDGILRIPSQAKLLRVLGGREIDKSKVIIPLRSLFKNGWRSRVWAAYLKANHNGKNISQKKLEDITGIPVRTQKSLGRYISSKRQIGITDRTADSVPGMNEYTTRGKAFVFVDPQRKNARVAAIHLPSVKTVSDRNARIAPAGRRTAILADLQRHGLACTTWLLSFQQADNRTVNRLFYSTPKQQKTAIRLTQDMKRLPHDPDRVFIQRGRRPAWDVVFLA
jgi:hypothetical protein